MRSRMGGICRGETTLEGRCLFFAKRGLLSSSLSPSPPSSTRRSRIKFSVLDRLAFAVFGRFRISSAHAPPRTAPLDRRSLFAPVRARDRERSIRDLAQRRAALVIIRENRMLPPPSLPTSSNLSPSSEPIQTLQYLLTDSENKRETVFPHPEERRKQVVEKAKRICRL